MKISGPSSSTGTQRDAILLSVKPEYAQAILEGIKKYEFRKIRVRDEVKGMLLYASSPRKQLVGYVEIDEVLEASPRRLWDITGAWGGISRKLYLEYFEGRDRAYGIKIKKVHVFPAGIDPKEIFPNFVAPQSFMYVDMKTVDSLLEGIKDEKKNSVRRRGSRSR